jgi:hypothetical protein
VFVLKLPFVIAMFRLPALLAIALLGLCACNDDDDDEVEFLPIATPTPIPGATPIPGTDVDGDGSTDGGTGIDEGTGDNGDGSTDGGTSDDGNGGGSGFDTGAPMSSSEEAVGRLSIESDNFVATVVTVERLNGEVWEFEVAGIPATRIGTTLTYRNSGLVFGSLDGVLVFGSSAVAEIVSSQRIQ